jgi:FKBP-type peptidyl-prolyl cis-trans isomerase 2
MFPKKLKNDTSGLARTALIIIIVLVMLSASTLAIVLYQGNQDATNKANRKVANGDTVKVDYIGNITGGRVFDTSLASVANDASILKALSFTLRANTSYTPLSFTVGGGTLITGFNNAVIGMKVGETKTVNLTASQGYGLENKKLITNFTLTETKDIYQNMTFAQFKANYSVSAVAGMTLVDPVYKWPVMVLVANTDADLVRIQNAPVQGQNYWIYHNSTAKAAGWNITVTSVNTSFSPTGQIVLVHDLTASDSGMLRGVDQKGTTFILDNVNLTTGTAHRNANTELVGKVLTFKITLVSIA